MDFEVVCDGLVFPEGPIWMRDGSILVTEIAVGRISRVQPDGRKEVVSECGGGPNGAAIGPDGALYVCNNGGLACIEENGIIFASGLAAEDYDTGRIERIDIATGKVERLYESVDGRNLRGPNDIVFDHHGGFWFSDFGKHFAEYGYYGGIFYGRADGSGVTRVVDALDTNGIGLSPDGTRLYVAQTRERLVLEFELSGPGQLARPGEEGRLVTSFPGRQQLDSMAITADGHICLGRLFDDPGIVVIDPATGQSHINSFPDIYTTNICFGGEDMQDAWITLTTTGQLAKARWDRPGLKLAHYV